MFSESQFFCCLSLSRIKHRFKIKLSGPMLRKNRLEKWCLYFVFVICHVSVIIIIYQYFHYRHHHFACHLSSQLSICPKHTIITIINVCIMFLISYFARNDTPFSCHMSDLFSRYWEMSAGTSWMKKFLSVHVSLSLRAGRC